MPSIFSRIVAGEIPSWKVAEDENYLAFLDAFPLVKGHTLVVPKQETDYIFDLNEKDYTGLMLFSRRVAGAVKEAMGSKRCSMQAIGLEVPHAHVHIIPINSMKDCDFSQPKLKFSNEEFSGIAAQIRARFR
jgi:histidine triad (HIT) family protein